MIGRMIVRGIGSKLGGGKFENWAWTAAMGYLFNELAGLTTNAQRGWGAKGDKFAEVLITAHEGAGIYNRQAILSNEDGGVISAVPASIDPDLRQERCRNGCRRIASGEHPFAVEPRSNFDGNVLVLGNNGRVNTFGSDLNQNGSWFATGVYVHSGYHRGTNTEGCVAISPNYWRSFIGSFNRGNSGSLGVVQ
jgi:hypothetical protein